MVPAGTESPHCTRAGRSIAGTRCLCGSDGFSMRQDLAQTCGWQEPAMVLAAKSLFPKLSSQVAYARDIAIWNCRLRLRPPFDGPGWRQLTSIFCSDGVARSIVTLFFLSRKAGSRIPQLLFRTILIAETCCCAWPDGVISAQFIRSRVDDN